MRYRRLGGATGRDFVFGAGPGEFLVNSPDTVQQAVVTRLRLLQGEWFLDKTVGTPYTTEILGFGTQRTYDLAVQTVILNTQGVNSIASYASTLDGRALTINTVVNTIYGQITIATTL